MTSSSEGLSLHVTVTIAPENVTKFLDAFTPAYKHVIAEPECTFFAVYQNQDNPGELSWVEHWTKSKEWLLTVQFTKEYYKEYAEITEPMLITPRQFKFCSIAPGLSTVQNVE